MTQKSQYRIFQEKIERAHQVPILDVAAHFGYGPFEETHRGKLLTRCPFHLNVSSPPAFSLNTKKNFWFCTTCGGGGRSNSFSAVRACGSVRPCWRCRMSSTSRNRQGDLERLQRVVKRMPTDALLALSVMSSREIGSRFARFFSNPDELRGEVGHWSDLALKIVAESTEVAIESHYWRPELDTMAELVRLLTAERLVRDLRVEDDSEV